MKKYLSLFTLIGLLVGIIIAFVFPSVSGSIEFIGTYYVTILKYFIAPVIFTCISYTVFKTNKNKERLVGKSILTFTIMYIITFLLTSLLVWIINPSSGFVFDEIKWTGSVTKFELLSVIKNLFPTSLNDIFVSPKIFSFILFAFIFGKVCAFCKLDKTMKIVEKIKNILLKILEYFMYTTPFAALALISNTIVKYGPTLLSVGAKYIACAWICGLFTMIIVMILPCLFIANIRPIDYIKKTYRVWLMTLTTCSSAACLTNTVRTCKEEFNVPDKITDVVVPLGCTIHMCGGAVSFALLGLFSSGLYGVSIDFVTYLVMIFSSLLINMAAPGIPNGGIVIGASYLELLGIPLGFIGFYSGIYKFLDMCYTTLNVTGDITANVLINHYENKH